MWTRTPLLILSATFLACGGLLALRPTAEPWTPVGAKAQPLAQPARVDCLDHDPLRQAFFGDLHVHTKHSMDARARGMLGSPDDALQFARGEPLALGPFDEKGKGARVAKLERPLDFAAVTDHAEWIGEVNLCVAPDSPVRDSESCRAYRGEIPVKSPIPGIKFASKLVALAGLNGRKRDICGDDGALCRAALLTAWEETQQATERWNDPTETCRFTAFHGWEHSYSASMSKVHRNILFRNASVPELPISSLESPDAVDLWDQLDAQCTNAGTGCEVVTIPHNPNVSNGRLFEIPWKRASRKEQIRQAQQRARMDRVVEMMQVKGESECRSGFASVLGDEDELCNFEKIRSFKQPAPKDCGEGIGSGALRGAGCQSRWDFARYALAEGFREAERIGTNPFQFGFIGSTDGHNANPGDVEEESYQGCCAADDAEAVARLKTQPSFAGSGQIARNPGGLMGVWSEENSRDSIFDAMVRRETFATSGPRIEPRFFGGWDLPTDLCERSDLVAEGYAQGVPMGDVLPRPMQSGGAPVFVASVQRDAGTPSQPGGQLDRLQIIKVWHGDDNTTHQRVYDVDGRLARPESRAEAEVDLATCEPKGRGYDELCAVWSDPEFNPRQSAAYYVRVVENPSCRWSWRTCLALPESERPESCDDPEVPRIIQERAWTSPIWFEAASPAIARSAALPSAPATVAEIVAEIGGSNAPPLAGSAL